MKKKSINDVPTIPEIKHVLTEEDCAKVRQFIMWLNIWILQVKIFLK